MTSTSTGATAPQITPTFTVDGITFDNEASAEAYLESRRNRRLLCTYLQEVLDLPEPEIEGLVQSRSSGYSIKQSISRHDSSIVVKALSRRLAAAADIKASNEQARLIQKITELLYNITFPEGDVAQENEEVA